MAAPTGLATGLAMAGGGADTEGAACTGVTVTGGWAAPSGAGTTRPGCGFSVAGLIWLVWLAGGWAGQGGSGVLLQAARARQAKTDQP